jgi:hypothetical protein
MPFLYSPSLFIYTFFPFFCHLFFFLYPFYLRLYPFFFIIYSFSSVYIFYFFSFNTPALHLLVSAGRLDKQWQQREYNWVDVPSPKRMGRHGTRDDYEVCESDLRHGIASQGDMAACQLCRIR